MTSKKFSIQISLESCTAEMGKRFSEKKPSKEPTRPDQVPWWTQEAKFSIAQKVCFTYSSLI